MNPKMEEFEFPCPKCGEPLISDEETAGKEAVCPYCDKLILMPKQAPTVRPAPAPDQVPAAKFNLPGRRQSGTPLPETPVVNAESQEAVLEERRKTAGGTRLPTGASREAREDLGKLAAMATGPQIDPMAASPTKGQISFHCPGCARLIWIRPKDAGKVVNCGGCSQDVICPARGIEAKLLKVTDPAAAVSHPKTQLPSHRSADHLPAETLSAIPGGGAPRTLLPAGPNRPGRTLSDSPAPSPTQKPKTNVKPIPKQRDVEISPSELKRYRAVSKERRIQRATAPHEDFKSPAGGAAKKGGTVLPSSRQQQPSGRAAGGAASAGSMPPPPGGVGPRMPAFVGREDLEDAAAEQANAWGAGSGQPARGTRRLVLLALMLGLPALAAAVYFVVKNQNDAPTVPVGDEVADSSIDESKAAEALLRRFLATRKIEEQLPLVRHPDVTEARMRIYAEQGNSPFAQDVEFGWPDSGWISGKKFTWIDVKFKDGASRTAVFEITPEGPKLDWESFVLFADPLMSDFVSRQPSEPAVYRVTCTLGDYYNRLYKDEFKYLCLELLGADEVSSCWAYTETNSEIAVELARLFAEKGQPVKGADGESRPAIKVMLKLHFDREEGQSNSQAWIDAVVSESWMVP
jgi:DNA-directed RNA polymerase subunit RPC12/RpoP